MNRRFLAVCLLAIMGMMATSLAHGVQHPPGNDSECCCGCDCGCTSEEGPLQPCCLEAKIPTTDMAPPTPASHVPDLATCESTFTPYKTAQASNPWMPDRRLMPTQGPSRYLMFRAILR